MLEVIKEGVKFLNILLLFFILLTVLVFFLKKVKLPSKKWNNLVENKRLHLCKIKVNKEEIIRFHFFRINLKYDKDY